MSNAVTGLLKVDPALIIDESKVTLGRVLGAGGSGVVKQGTLEQRHGRSVDVAVKMISTGDERLFETEVTSLCACVRACACDKCVLAHFSFVLLGGAAVRPSAAAANAAANTSNRLAKEAAALLATRVGAEFEVIMSDRRL